MPSNILPMSSRLSSASSIDTQPSGRRTSRPISGISASGTSFAASLHATKWKYYAFTFLRLPHHHPDEVPFRAEAEHDVLREMRPMRNGVETRRWRVRGAYKENAESGTSSYYQHDRDPQQAHIYQQQYYRYPQQPNAYLHQGHATSQRNNVYQRQDYARSTQGVRYVPQQHTSSSTPAVNAIPLAHPHPPPETFPDSPPEYNEQLESKLIQAATQWIPRDTPQYATPERKALSKPVVVPRVGINSILSFPLPFLRAYSPALRSSGVHEQEFIAFVDNLTVVQTQPAPLQALGFVGTGIGFVPWHWAALAGMGIEAAATTASIAITTARTKRYLETVNREYFAPKGLKVSVYKDGALAEMLGFPESWPDLALVDADLSHSSIRDRRMRALEPFIASLSLDVPPPAPQVKMIDKIAAKQVARKLSKQEKSALKKQKKLMERKESGKDKQKDTEKQARKDEKKAKKLQYIVVENLSF
ncbi:hypothetical protein EJ04DRAFT_554411 [Polyplosphaeria fusca]|uniref:Uncharacterized protein n=1 Tax=Polyplosphaeria fusca TaxID=682080 RepID=A0A9P4UX88_9PLEO|nr:hypothetical protein EJ04DRAFT_554411 [Polyplosphaeria fusca]